MRTGKLKNEVGLISAQPRTMKWHTRGLATVCVATFFVLAGCNSKPANNSASTANTSQPASASNTAAAANPASAGQPAAEGTQAGAPAPAQAPAVASVPAAAAAAPPAANVPPPPPPPPVYTVATGSRLAVRIANTLSAKNNNVGDGFRGTLAQSVRVRGVTVFRAGTRVTGTVIAAKGRGRFKGAGDLGITVNTIGGQTVSTSEYERVEKGKGKRTAGFIGGGGGGGALIGGLAGGGKGALIGGLIGAGAGTAGAAFTGNKDVTIPAETVVTFTLTAPVRVTGAAPAAPASENEPPA